MYLDFMERKQWRLTYRSLFIQSYIFLKKLKLFIDLLIYLACLYVYPCVCACATVYVWLSEDNLRELFLSSHDVGTRD